MYNVKSFYCICQLERTRMWRLLQHQLLRHQGETPLWLVFNVVTLVIETKISLPYVKKSSKKPSKQTNKLWLDSDSLTKIIGWSLVKCTYVVGRRLPFIFPRRVKSGYLVLIKWLQVPKLNHSLLLWSYLEKFSVNTCRRK